MHRNVPRVHTKYRQQRGFGLIELLVSISIMLLVSSIILVRHNRFDSAVLLRNQAFEVAFSIREAQNLAVSAVFTDGGGDIASYRQRYGVHMTIGSPTYYLFRDSNGDGSFQNSEALGQPLRLDPRFRFASLGGNTSGSFDVMFQRPNFDAIFNPDPGGTATIIIESTAPVPDGSAQPTREVEITATGQISVLSI